MVRRLSNGLDSAVLRDVRSQYFVDGASSIAANLTLSNDYYVSHRIPDKPPVKVRVEHAYRPWLVVLADFEGYVPIAANLFHTGTWLLKVRA